MGRIILEDTVLKKHSEQTQVRNEINNYHLSSEPALISARMSLTSGNLKAHSMIFKQEIVGTYMWVRHDVRITPPPKDIMAEKTATVLWNNWLKKFLKPGSVLLLSFSSSPIELLPGAVDRPRSKQLESQTLNTKYKMY